MSIVKFDKVLLPIKGVDLKKWSVVACDQYTSNKAYWDDLTKFVGESPSTLNLICPEAYLKQADKQIAKIKHNAVDYAENVLEEVDGSILVKRTTESGVRHGLMTLIDLEEYSFVTSDTALIRATEGTVTDRIPPRLKVRQACDLELPHILVLIDDRDNEVVEPCINSGVNVYDVDLYGGGGRLEGYQIADTDSILQAIESVKQKTSERVGQPLLMLVGDGNHSLATALALYNQFKEAGDERAEKARYALVEVENIWQEGIQFEPIHRLYVGSDASKLADMFVSRCTTGADAEMIIEGKKVNIKLANDSIDAYKQVQGILDEFMTSGVGEVDYIHGDEELVQLSGGSNSLGILMPAVEKSGIFEYVAKNGAMPRKTFSMGNAWEKRYYMESRNLKK